MSNNDLHRSVLASVSAALDERPLPDLPSSSDSPDSAQTPDDEEDQPGYQDGDLPDFSDPEEEDLANHASGSAGGGSRLVPGKARGGAGGMRGKGKIPLSALKNRIQTGASKAKSAVSSSSSSNKALPSTPSSSSALVPTSSDEPSSSKGKGKSKALKLSNDELDKIAQKIKADNPSLPDLDRNQVVELLEQLQIDEDFVKGKKGLMNKGAKDTGSFKFWKTQPVVSLETSTFAFSLLSESLYAFLSPPSTTEPEDIHEGPLEPDTPADLVPKDPVALHKDFAWCTVDLNDPVQLKEVYELLTHHYVEDQDASFRFDYSPEFIEWCVHLSPRCLHSGGVPSPDTLRRIQGSQAAIVRSRLARRYPRCVDLWQWGARSEGQTRRFH